VTLNRHDHAPYYAAGDSRFAAQFSMAASAQLVAAPGGGWKP